MIGGVGAARNVISGNTNAGVQLTSATDNRIEGNFIGLDVTGTAAVGNQMGVFIDSGTSNDVVGNVLSGNSLYGIRTNAPANIITSNRIGTNSAGSAAVPNNAHGIYITNASDNQVIDNLVSGNSSDGIFIQKVSSDPTGTLLQGNFIGTNAAGTSAIPNNIGVRMHGTSNVTIGGNTTVQRNLISGNIVDGVNLQDNGIAPNTQPTNNHIKGNYIGLNAAGTAAIPNGFVGISLHNASNNTIGGSLPGEGNVISGNASGGVRIGAGTTSNDNIIIGNRIGTNPTGAAAIGNGGNGIGIVPSAGGAATGNRIGGPAAAERNVIGGNPTGVNILGSMNADASANDVLGNYIGIAADGVTALPNGSGVRVTGDSNQIGIASGGNLISGNTAHGISVGGWSNVIQGNKVGTNATGTAAVPNGLGIAIENRIDVIADTLIGGDSAGQGNLISGNFGPGIAMAQDVVNPDLLNPNPGNPAPWQTVVQGNLIGTAANGLDPLPNGGHGISATIVSEGLIGGANSMASNIIYHNALGGIVVADDARVTITGNSLDGNGGLDIDLGNDGVTLNDANDPDAGPNQRQNYPFVNSAGPSGGNTEISVSFQSTPNTTFTLQVYSSPTCNPSGSGGGRTLRSTRVFATDASGNLGFVHVFAGPTPSGHVITITATDPAGNTSEFSPCRAMP
jgi:parallel beta-helix repeat protein